MTIKDIMSREPEYIDPSTSLKEAAQKMEELDCGFLAIGENDRLTGVVTDRDIAIRAVARGVDPNLTTASDIQTPKVLYCFESDEISDVAENMQKNQVYRLIVLNNKEDKRLCGIVTLGDIVRNDNTKDAEHAAKGISAKQQNVA